MFNGKRIVALCLNKINEEHNHRFLVALHKELEGTDIRVIAFQSTTDYFFGSLSDSGQEKVYSLLSFDIADALIVVPQTFKNKDLLKRIVSRAKEHNRPVVSYAEYLAEADVNVLEDHGDVFARLVEHLISVHNIKRPFLLSGIEGDEHTVNREKQYLEVLAKHGIDVDRENYWGYGQYWSEPAIGVMENFLARVRAGEVPMADAFVCVNDTMAVTACDCLHKHGYSVPDDVLVTGFDGIDPDNIIIPTITTCEHDFDQYAKLTMNAVLDLLEGKTPEKVQNTAMKLKLVETCGCASPDHVRYQQNSVRIYRHMVESDYEASYWSKIPSKCVNPPTFSNVQRVILNYLPHGSGVSLSENFLEMDLLAEKANSFSKKQMLLAGLSSDGEEAQTVYYDIKDAPKVFGKFMRGNIEVITAINFNQIVFGFVSFEFNQKDPEVLEKITKFVYNFGNALMIINAQLKNASLLNQIDDISLTDSYTGLPTLKGLEMIFAERIKDIDVEHSRMSLCVYSITNWNEILKKYGVEEAQYVLDTFAETLERIYPKRSLIGKVTEMEFAVITDYDTKVDVEAALEVVGFKFKEEEEEFKKINEDRGHHYLLDILNAHIVTDIPEEAKLTDFVMQASNMIVSEHAKRLAAKKEKSHISEQDIELFNKLINENLFRYVFQPIVSTENGEIVAYETLMRTEPEIGFFPDKILDIAEFLDNLYSVERATLFNSLENYCKYRDKIKNRKLFINAIPGQFLNDEDRILLHKEYDVRACNVVIEATEQFKDSEEEKELLLKALNANGWGYAIDDYGSGNSNIENLLKHKPDVIKIDRFLITEIHENPNKQFFVKNIIEFAKANGIKVLAEGVETKEEMKYVIGAGVDLLQGYYLARPNEEILDSISDKVKKEIVTFFGGRQLTK